MTTPQRIGSAPKVAQDALAIVHEAIEIATTGDEDRLAEYVHAMLANPILAALCMWTFVHTSESLLGTVADSHHSTPAEVWAKLAPGLAEAELARAAAGPQPALSGGGR